MIHKTEEAAMKVYGAAQVYNGYFKLECQTF